MTERIDSRIPQWAEQERSGDLAWIQENAHILWPAAQIGYTTVGRGAIVVDTTYQPTPESGHPFGYVDQAAIRQEADSDTQRLVQEYDPDREFVTTLFKTSDRVSSYRIQTVPKNQLYNEPGQIVRQHPPQPAETPIEPDEQEGQPPDIETLMQWEVEGGCEAACPHQCWVEPDGVCSHGHQSWLLELGLI